MSQGFVNPKPSPLPVNQGGTGVLTSTGTVAVVLSTSPTLVTPTIGAATATSIKISNTGIIDTNGKVALAFVATTNAVNVFTLTNSIATASPSLAATGTDTNIIMTLNGKGTGGIAAKGTSTNDNAGAGYVGEFVSSNIVAGSAVALTTGVAANITSISLTAGDWDVWGTIALNPAGTTTTSQLFGGISTTTATLPTAPGGGAYLALFNYSLLAGQGTNNPVGTTRISISGTTTVYLVVTAAFAVSTNSGYGFIGARRVR